MNAVACAHAHHAKRYGKPPVAVDLGHGVTALLPLDRVTAGRHTEWVWRSQDDACDECADLDGSTYPTRDEIPERLHPNCKCTIEQVVHTMHRKKLKVKAHKRGKKKIAEHKRSKIVKKGKVKGKRKPKLWTNPKNGKKKR